MKFNLINKKTTVTKNHAGAKAYKMSPEYELYSAVVTTGLNGTHYEKSNDRLKRIIKLINKCKPEFVAKLAIYTRNTMYLRSIPIVLTVELAKKASGSSLISDTINHVVKRADEITELLAYYQFANQRTETKKLNRLSKQIQKGLIKSFNNFDEYQFAKYNKKAAVTLRDALFLVHPKAKDETQQTIFDKIASNTLSTPYTWETEMSKVGQYSFGSPAKKVKAIAKKWEELIASKRLGYMALLRNLRNILEADVSPHHIRMVCDYLSNEKAIENAKQLPFRFLSAYRELKNVDSYYVSQLLNALETAVTHSAKNINGFDYDTRIVIACDVSGSMQKPISPKSKVLLYDIGLMLAMLLQSQCKSVVSGMFGDRWKVINMSTQTILNNVNEYYRREGEVGYATNGHLIIKDLIKKNQIVDKVMVFTDVQMWNSNYATRNFETLWNSYKRIAPNAKL